MAKAWMVTSLLLLLGCAENTRSPLSLFPPAAEGEKKADGEGNPTDPYGGQNPYDQVNTGGGGSKSNGGSSGGGGATDAVMARAAKAVACEDVFDCKAISLYTTQCCVMKDVAFSTSDRSLYSDALRANSSARAELVASGSCSIAKCGSKPAPEPMCYQNKCVVEGTIAAPGKDAKQPAQQAQPDQTQPEDGQVQ